MSTESQSRMKLKRDLASRKAEGWFKNQTDELQLQSELQRIAQEKEMELQRIAREKEMEGERKLLEIRLKKLREDGQVAGMEAELSILGEEEAGGNGSLTSEAGGNQNISPVGINSSPDLSHPDGTGGWSLPDPVRPPLNLGNSDENKKGVGRDVVESSTPKGVVETRPNSESTQPAKSVGFMLPENSVHQPGSVGGFVDRTLEGIISGNLKSRRAQSSLIPVPLSTGTISRNQPTRFLPSGVQPGSHGVLLGPTNSFLPLVTAGAVVTATTATTTQSRGTVPSSRNSSSQVMTTSSHGGSPGELHPHGNNL